MRIYLKFMNFSQGHSKQKFNVNRACFPMDKHQNSQKGEIHELFVLALSLVWFAGATPELCQNLYSTTRRLARKRQESPKRRRRFLGAAKRGGFKRGGFPIWTCPSFFFSFFFSVFFLFCPFRNFPDFSEIFPICPGTLRDFPDLVLFLFLGL